MNLSFRSLLLVLPFLITASPFTRAAEAVRPDTSRLPMMFESNAGQFDPEIDFIARGPGYQMALKPGELLMSLKARGKAAEDSERSFVRCRLAGAGVSPRGEGEDGLACKMSYFLGNDPAQWRTEVPTYAKVRYARVYPGIDLVYYGNQRELEYDFIVAAGADPSVIGIEFDTEGEIDAATGDLIFHFPDGLLRHRAPVAYQENAGDRVPVACRYVLKGPRSVAFALDAYDPRQELIIDPVMSYSTYFGGIDFEGSNASVVDTNGNTYVTGSTDGAAKFGSSQLSRVYNGGNDDAFVLKMNAAGTTIERGTLIGGSGHDRGLAIAVDATGNVYVAGQTDSVQNQVAPGATANTMPSTGIRGYDKTAKGANGNYDAFVLRINNLFTQVTYSTFFGGEGEDVAHGIALAPDGHVWVVGLTASPQWNLPSQPAVPGNLTPHNPGLDGTGLDAFVLKLNTNVASDNTGLEFLTFLGGNRTDEAHDVAVDTAGNAYVVGLTYSTDFPLEAALQTQRNRRADGGLDIHSDAFFTKFSPTGAQILVSTYLGGEFFDSATAIAVDANSRAYIAGSTVSKDFPIRNAAQRVHGPVDLQGVFFSDIFVTRLNPQGTDYEYSTFIGGSGIEDPEAIVVDSQFAAYVVGSTTSPDFPLAHAFNSVPDPNQSHGVFVKLNADGNHFNVSTFVGGTGADIVIGVGLDSQGIVYINGWTSSDDFFTTPGALQGSRSGNTSDLFFQRFGINTQPPVLTFTSPLSSPRGQLGPITGTVEDNNLSGLVTYVQIVELNPVVRYWNGTGWELPGANGTTPWLIANTAGLGWQLPAAKIPARAQTSPGTYTIKAQVEDADGNESPIETINIVRNPPDTTPPVIVFTSPSAEGQVITTGGTTLSFSATDPETDVFAVGAALGKIEGNATTWWNGTTWQAAFTTLPVNSSGTSHTLQNPPTGANRPNGDYVFQATAQNGESPPLNTPPQQIHFSVDFHPAYTWTGAGSPQNNLWDTPGNWTSPDAPGTAPGSGANVTINSGTPAIPGGQSVFLNRLTISGGTLANHGSLSVAKAFEMTGGTLNGESLAVTLFSSSTSKWTAGTVTGTLTVSEGALLEVTGLAAYKYLGAATKPCTIDNAGTIRWTGNATAASIRGHGDTGGATINNLATGIFEIAGNGAPLSRTNASNLVFNNRGRIVKTAGTGTSSLDEGEEWTLNMEPASIFENAVADATSVLQRAGGSAVTNVKSGSIFRGPGRIRFAGSTPVNAEAGHWVIDGDAPLDFDGMVLACPQTNSLTFQPSANAALRWLSGIIHGNLEIPAGFTLAVTGAAAYKYLGADGKQGTINNAGIIAWAGAPTASIRGHGGNGPATINNLAHARLLIQGDGSPLSRTNATNLVFNNAGRVIKTAGTDTSALDEGGEWILNNSTGAFIENAVAGSVLQRTGQGATTNLAAGSVFYGPGIIRFAGAAPVSALEGAWDVTGGAVLDLNGMVLTCPQTGNLTLQPSANAVLQWVSGTIQGNLNIPAGATLTVTGASAYKYLGDAGKEGTINNAGTIRWTGNLTAASIRGHGDNGAATINNLATGIFEIGGNGAPLSRTNASNLVFNNLGRIVKSAGTAASSLDEGEEWTLNMEPASIFENAVADATSVLQRSGGSAVTNVKSGSIFRGPGRIRFASATPLNAEVGHWVLDGAPFDLDGMALACPQAGSLTFQPSANAVLRWLSGEIHGNLDIAAGVTLTVTGASAYKYLGAAGKKGTINNAGTIRWTGNATAASIRGHGDTGAATINNLATGTFEIAGNGAPLSRTNVSNLVFNNRGRIVKTAGTGASSLDEGEEWTLNLEAASVFENVVADAASVLQRSGGSAVTNVKSGSIFRGPGRIRFASSTPLNAEAGHWAVEGAPFDLDGMVLACPQTGTLTLQSSGGAVLRWLSGIIQGNLTIPSGAMLSVTGLDAFKYLGTEGKPGTITNAGNMTWVGDTAAASIRGHGTTGAATINNQGTLNFLGNGEALSRTNAAGNSLVNSGTINLGSSPGAISSTWNFTQTTSGILNIEIAGPATTQFDRFTTSGAATLGGTVNVIKLNGYAPAIGTTFDFFTAASRTGTFATVNGGFTAEYTATSASLKAGASTVLTFADWATQRGLSGADALVTANPDGDDRNNWAEYVFNSDPKTSTPATELPTVVPIGGQQWLTLNYRRWADREAAGVVYTPQLALDLVTWGSAGITDEVDASAPVIPGSTAYRARVPLVSPLQLLRIEAKKP